MDKSKNLQLWLPEDSDPLEVSKLSENFETLDGALGSGAEALVKSMKIGDITYSTRNLEEESGGKLIACDQRTIDTSEYPGIPKHILYWPYPVAIGTKLENTVNMTFGEVLFGVRALSTDNIKYVSSGTAGSNSVGTYIAIYNEETGVLTCTLKVVTGAIQQNSWFCRVTDSLIYYSHSVGSGAQVYLYSNDLTTRETITSVANAANYISHLYAVGAGIYRLANGRLLILTYVNNGNALNGVRYTDDMFNTLLSSSAPTEMAADISRVTSMAIASSGTSNSTYRDATDHFHPVVIDGDKIYVICYPVENQRGSYTTNPVTDAEIEAVYPTIYYSDDNGLSFQKRQLPDGLIETLRTFFDMDVEKPSVLYYYTYFWLSNTCFRLGDHIYIKYANGYRYAKAGSDAIDTVKYIMYIAINLKTNQVDYVSNAIDAGGNIDGPLPHNLFRNSYIKKFVYVKNNNMLYFYNSDGNIYKLNLQTFEVENLSGTFIPGTISGDAVQIGPTCYAMKLTKNMDIRLNQQGVGVPSSDGFRIIDTDDFIPGKSEIEASTIFPMNNLVFGNGIVSNTAAYANSPMVEYNGDIYVVYADMMHKMPKNKKQMPYIKNGYIKALGEEASE